MFRIEHLSCLINFRDRLLNRKFDSPHADLEFHRKNDIQKYARFTCADFNQTVNFIAILEVKLREFQAETGSTLDPDVLARILGSAIDEDTLGRLEGSGVDIKSYDATKVWVENRHTKQ